MTTTTTSFIRAGLAAYRLTRLYQRDSITLGLRTVVEQRVLGVDSDGLPVGTLDRDSLAWKARYKLHELLICFYCLSVWLAFFTAAIGKRRSSRWLLDGLAGAAIAAIIEDQRATARGGY